MNNYKELIDRLTNGTDMPGYDEGDALDWYSHITDEAAEAIKQLVAERAELADLLRLFSGAAYPVSKEIDPRGYRWSEAYLDAALAKLGADKGDNCASG